MKRPPPASDAIAAVATVTTVSVAPVIRKLIVGIFMASVLMVGFSLPAFADPSCYTGCFPGPVSIVGKGPSVAPSGPGVLSTPAPLPRAGSSVPSSGGLPFTGADVEQSIGLAAVLVVAGVAVLRVGRRRARPTS